MERLPAHARIGQDFLGLLGPHGDRAVLGLGAMGTGDDEAPECERQPYAANSTNETASFHDCLSHFPDSSLKTTGTTHQAQALGACCLS